MLKIITYWQEERFPRESNKMKSNQCQYICIYKRHGKGFIRMRTVKEEGLAGCHSFSILPIPHAEEIHLCIITNNNWEKGLPGPFAHLCIEKSSRLHRRHRKTTKTRPQCPMQVWRHSGYAGLVPMLTAKERTGKGRDVGAKLETRSSEEGWPAGKQDCRRPLQRKL